jgi:hypothetical protein
VESEVEGLKEEDRPLARLALIVARAPYQVDESLVQPVLGTDNNEERLIRVLDWASFVGSCRVARFIADQTAASSQQSKLVA